MRVAAAGTLAALLLLASCSDDDTPAPSSAVTTPADTSDGTAPDTTAPGGTGAAAGDTAVHTTLPLEPGSARLEVVAGGIDRPVDVAWRAADERMFVVSQAGAVYSVDGNGSVGQPVLQLEGIANDGEQGLLGLAFHPTEPFAYVNYTDADGATVVAEYQVADDGAFGSPRTVITIPQPYANHNGGQLAFGPDGLLYIGMGDGGAADDVDRRALDTGDLLGKLLRIDPLVDPLADQGPYSIPADNPYVDTPGARPEIWAIGLRNPWRFSFDRDNGDLWIGDVGQGEWEEVDVARAATGGGRGANFGWSAYEGTHRFNDDQTASDVLMPVYEYQHGDLGCSVSGGAVYRGTAIEALRNHYVFSDFCSGLVWGLNAGSEPGDSAEVVELTRAVAVSAIVAGPDGELYVLSHTDGTISRLVPA